MRVPKVIDRPEMVPRDGDEFYWQLVTRNGHFVTPEAQARLRDLKLLVAGCGSAGGACVEPLARLGVERFRLADNGAYELSNLNRQHGFPQNLAQNKAEFHLEQLRRLNPFVDAQAFPQGLTPTNVNALVAWADIVIDAVDVTTRDGMLMKLALHECAAKARKPVFCMLDVGFRQWGMSFDYRKPGVRPLNGKLEAAKNAVHPIRALFTMFPLSSVPDHCLDLIHELLTDGTRPASQLRCAADLLSATMSAAILRFAETGDVVRGWDINLDGLVIPWRRRVILRLRGFFTRARIRRLLRSVP